MSFVVFFFFRRARRPAPGSRRPPEPPGEAPGKLPRRPCADPCPAPRLQATARGAPSLYRATVAGADLSPLSLLAWAAAAVWHSAVCFALPAAALAAGAGGGRAAAPLGLWATGTLSFTMVVVVVNLKLLVASRTHTRAHAAVVFLSILAYAAYLAAYAAVPPRLLHSIAPAGAMYGVAAELAAAPAAWATLAVGVAACLLPDAVLSARWRGDTVAAGDAATAIDRKESVRLPAVAPVAAAARGSPAPRAPHRAPSAHTGYAFAPPVDDSFHADEAARAAARRSRAGPGGGP